MAIAATLAVSIAGAGCERLDADGFEGGCEPYAVHAQNRYPPRGATIREKPDINSRPIGSLGLDENANEVVNVRGWLNAEPAYPNNPEPWQGGIWFKLAYRSGYVNSAAVRGEATTFDETGTAPDGGEPAPTPSECEGTYKP